jgi:hypothetical protein
MYTLLIAWLNSPLEDVGPPDHEVMLGEKRPQQGLVLPGAEVFSGVFVEPAKQQVRERALVQHVRRLIGARENPNLLGVRPCLGATSAR